MPDVETINPIESKHLRRQVRPDKNKTPEGEVFFVWGEVCHGVKGVHRFVLFGERSATV
jgi:hypothetical protein